MTNRPKATAFRQSGSNWRYQPGDHVRIPLGNSRFGFLRVFDNFAIGVFSHTVVGESEVLPESFGKIVLYTTWATNAFRGEPRWPVVQRSPFKDESESYVPPFYIDVGKSAFQVRTSEGRTLGKVTTIQPKGLFPSEMCSPAGLVKRIRLEFRINAKGTLIPIGKRRFESRDIAWARDPKTGKVKKS